MPEKQIETTGTAAMPLWVYLAAVALLAGATTYQATGDWLTGLIVALGGFLGVGGGAAGVKRMRSRKAGR